MFPKPTQPLQIEGCWTTRRRIRNERRRHALHAAIWLVGAAGFLFLLAMARESPHAVLLRAAALIWFFAFGVLNAWFVFRVFPSRRKRTGKYDSFEP